MNTDSTIKCKIEATFIRGFSFTASHFKKRHDFLDKIRVPSIMWVTYSRIVDYRNVLLYY